MLMIKLEIRKDKQKKDKKISKGKSINCKKKTTH